MGSKQCARWPRASWVALGRAVPAGRGTLSFPSTPLVSAHLECCVQCWARQTWSTGRSPAKEFIWCCFEEKGLNEMRTLPTSTALRFSDFRMISSCQSNFLCEKNKWSVQNFYGSSSTIHFPVKSHKMLGSDSCIHKEYEFWIFWGKHLWAFSVSINISSSKFG